MWRFAAAMLFCTMASRSFGAEAQGPALLELWINGQPHDVISVTLRDEGLFVDASDLARFGVHVPATGQINVRNQDGIAAAVDGPSQQLRLTVRADQMDRQNYDLMAGSEIAPVGNGLTGATLHYDLSASVDDAAVIGRTLAGGADLGLQIFSPSALFSATGFATADGHGARLDTAFEFDNQASLTHMVLGDAFTGALDWTRSLRFAGIQFARDFSLRPDLVTIPLPQFLGDATVPTTVDVYAGAAKLFEQDVAPGPFALSSLPIVTGGGNVTVVTRDILGRQTSYNLSLYTTPDLLAAGLDAFEFDAGFARRDYGVTSFSYDTPLATVTYRRGVADDLTLESHAEAAPGLGLAGLGAAKSLFGLGVGAGDVAVSTSDAGVGWLTRIALQGADGPISANASLAVASASYRDQASLDAPPPPRFQYQLGLNASLGRAGSLGVNWIGQKPHYGQVNEFLSGSYALTLKDGLFIGITALHDVVEQQWAAQIFLTLQVGQGAAASVSYSNNNGRSSGQAIFDNPADPDGGFGYRLSAQVGDNSQQQADASYVSDAARLDGGAALSGGKLALRADADGALVLLGGQVFATRDDGDAMALVDAGQSGVHIYRENRTVAVSDSDGLALLSGLNAFGANHLSVEARDYPMTALLPDNAQTVAPSRHGAVLVDFKPLPSRTLFVSILRADGSPLPKDARLAGGSGGILGHNGMLFVADAARAQDFRLVMDNQRCIVHIDPVSTTSPAVPPPVLCLAETADAH